MGNYTFSQLNEIMGERGIIALGRMMDIIEEQTGSFPSWDDIAPEWVVKNCLVR